MNPTTPSRNRRLLDAAALAALLTLAVVPAAAKPTITGVLDTAGDVYSTHDAYADRTSTEYRAYENISFEATFNDHWFFDFNSRAGYQSEGGGTTEHAILDFFYGYFGFTSDHFDLRAGRIMDFENLVYLSFDGLDLGGKFTFGDHRLTLDLYGGFIVKDDYLEGDRSTPDPRTLRSADYRALFTSQRTGDYVSGLTGEFFGEGIGVFGIEYQAIFNHNTLAEHYVSLNFETMFSKLVRIYGYGTLDLVEPLPSNTLLAIQVDPADLLSIVLSHEYYRPVFIRDSFFWAYFKPFGNQEASATLLFMIAKPLTIDVKYGAVIYDGMNEPGHEVALHVEHRDLGKCSLKTGIGMIVGPEGNVITAEALLKRHVLVFDLLAGCGVEWYNDTSLMRPLDTGYYATLGTDVELIRPLILSLTGDFSGNSDYVYDIRGNFSLKYIF